MQVAEAVADPVRRRVLELLRDEDLPAGDLAAAFDVSRPAVSRHLRVLREAGLVRVEVVGRRRVYALDRGPLAELDDWLGQFRPLVTGGGAVAATTASSPASTGAVTGSSAPHDRTIARAQGPAARLDALGTELRRGRRGRDDDRRRDDGTGRDVGRRDVRQRDVGERDGDGGRGGRDDAAAAAG
ncbi:metalloregulator ArsR/SmtB family transcription factor [Aquipuribacter hungaricus]|uniref:Metalloregulator ArsR/SmtB family transcription factor n=1 Tax=Aquipuribacter hungaricus TaxID=545624 RepID=A0ABV7WE03_9MICO